MLQTISQSLRLIPTMHFYCMVHYFFYTQELGLWWRELLIFANSMKTSWLDNRISRLGDNSFKNQIKDAFRTFNFLVYINKHCNSEPNKLILNWNNVSLKSSVLPRCWGWYAWIDYYTLSYREHFLRGE